MMRAATAAHSRLWFAIAVRWCCFLRCCACARVPVPVRVRVRVRVAAGINANVFTPGQLKDRQAQLKEEMAQHMEQLEAAAGAGAAQRGEL